MFIHANIKCLPVLGTKSRDPYALGAYILMEDRAINKERNTFKK